MSKYNHTVEIDNFASRHSRVPERQKIVKLNCVARALQAYTILGSIEESRNQVKSLGSRKSEVDLSFQWGV